MPAGIAAASHFHWIQLWHAAAAATTGTNLHDSTIATTTTTTATILGGLEVRSSISDL